MDIKIIDVTLRDGGYKTNFHFSDEAVEKIISSLDQSGIEYIEVGYRGGSIRPILNIGSAGLCAKKYLEKCRKLIRKSKLSVMLHPKNIEDKDLKELSDCGVDLVRICVLKSNYEASQSFIDKAKNFGLSVSVNVTRTSQYIEKELDTLVSMLVAHHINMIYFADSNGSMLPLNVKSAYEKYTQKYSTPLGFHAHDNLGLAQTNAIAALNGGAQYIDASLSGIGKGIGNLRLELFVSYLHAINVKKYNIRNILNVSNFVRSTIINKHDNIAMDELMMGIRNLSIEDIDKLKISLGVPLL